MIDMIPQSTIYALSAGLSAFTISLFFYSLYQDYRTAKARQKRFFYRASLTGSFLFRILQPMASFFGHFIASAANKIEHKTGSDNLMKFRIHIQRILTAAGSPAGLTADEYIGLQVVSILLWTGAGYLLYIFTGTGFMLLICVLIGAVHPSLWLRKKTRVRKTEIRNMLPYALDLLTLSVEAGLDFTSALDRMQPKLEGSALSEEFGELIRQIRLGKSRRDALRDMATRIQMPEVNGFCSSLIQADEMGADLGPVLRVMADQMRNDRSNRAEKKAMEAPVKILFPLIVFIFPTVFIILFAPLGINYLQGLIGP
jgi:tight adherence protein C